MAHFYAMETEDVSRLIRTTQHLQKKKARNAPVTKDGRGPPAVRPERNRSRTRHAAATSIKEHTTNCDPLVLDGSSD